MAKTENKKSVTDLQKLQDGLSTIGNDSPINPLDALNEFENVPMSSLEKLNAEYLKLEEDTLYNYIFTGTTTMFKDDKEIKCVELLDREGKKYITGAKVLVSALSKVEQVPCLVKIQTGKLIEGKAGEYMDMSVGTVPIRKGANS